MKKIICVLILIPCLVAFAQLGINSPFYIAGTLKPIIGGSNPTEVSDISGLFAWYKPDTKLTNTAGTSPPANGDNIMAWGDSSGNERGVVTNNPSTPPSWENSGVTGKSYGGLQVDASESMTAGFAAQANTTIFVVWRRSFAGYWGVAFDSTNASARQLLFHDNNDRFVMSSGTDLTTGNNTVAINTWYIQAGVFNGSGNDTLYTNGVQAATGDAGNQSLDGITIGTTYTGSLPPQGDGWIGEIVIYSRTLNGTEIGQVFGILNNRWSIY